MNRIRELREASGWNQEDLGQRLNVGKGAVSRYEQEKRQLDPVLICALCDIFGCTADYLLGRSDNSMPAVNDSQARLLAAYESASLRDRKLVDQILGLDVPEGKKDAAAI